jgi:HK97 family phage major capsid protein/HK97 family phage prohead protease
MEGAMTTRTRSIQLDRKASPGDVFPATLATESAVRRDFGFEVLDMARMDLSRAPFPLIEGHDQSRLNVGVVENVRIEGDRLRGDVRLGQSARAKELAEDIRAGIVGSLSVGYAVSDPVEDGEREGVPVYRFAAAVMEVSLVSVPADVRAGINRSYPNMETKAPDRDEETRRESIRQIGEKFDMQDLAYRAIADDWTVEQFNSVALERLQDRNNSERREPSQPTPRAFSRPTFSGLPVNGNFAGYQDAMRDYSLTRLLRGLADPKAMPEAELELEVSKRMQQALGKQSNSIMVPFEALEVPQARTLQIGDASGGANLKPTQHLGDSFIDILRTRSMIMQLGPTTLSGLQGDIVIPRKTSSTTAYWIEGDHDDALTQSDIALDQVTLSPKTVGGAVTFSHKMMIQSSPDIEMLVRRDLADMIAVEIDHKALNGTGLSNQPTGIFNQTGIQTKDFGAATPTFEEVCEMEAMLAAENADMGNVAWLMDPDMAKDLRTTPKQGSGVEGNFVWDSNIGGRVLDLPAYRSNNMPAGFLLLGNWQHLLVGFWGGIEIDADPYTHFLKGSVTVRVLADVDIAVRHPTAFVSGSDDYT